MEQITPKINTKELQEKANEYAQKGALQTLKDFYTGYNSPYRKAIEDNLKHKSVSNNLEIPDIVGKLNSLISEEVDKIANIAISKTFLPIAKRILTRGPSEIKLSEILKEFISLMRFDWDSEDPDEYEYSIRDIWQDDSILAGSSYRIILSNSRRTYELSISYEGKYNTENDFYRIYILPSIDKTSSHFQNKTMRIMIEDGATLELPFTENVLHDPFVTYCAQLMLANTEIRLDVEGFNDDMFPDKDICHC